MELFKFMPYRQDFFQKRLLRFTPATSFNDPFEGLVTTSSAVKELHNKLRKTVDGGKTWIPLTKDEIEKQKYFNNATHVLGILSLTRSKHSLLMWAHYAKNHTGIILGVDSTDPFFNQTISSERTSIFQIDTSLLGKVFPVTYERIRPELPLSHLGPFAFDEFLQKSEEWMYEKEYRMFMSLFDAKVTIKEKEQLISLFEIPESAITRIIMGVRSDKSKILADFTSAAKNNPKLLHIKVESAELHKELYHIEHHPVALDRADTTPQV